MIVRFAFARTLRVMLVGSTFLTGVGSSLNTREDPVYAASDRWLSPAFGAERSTTSASFADIVEKVKPAVIGVRVKAEVGARDRQPPMPPDLLPDRSSRQRNMPRGELDTPRDISSPGQPDMPRRREFTISQGAGFFIDPDGYAVTTNHVTEPNKTIEISTDDGKSYSAKLVGTDPSTDLALIKVEGGAADFRLSGWPIKRRASANGFLPSAIRSGSAAP